MYYRIAVVYAVITKTTTDGDGQQSNGPRPALCCPVPAVSIYVFMLNGTVLHDVTNRVVIIICRSSCSSRAR